MTVWMFLDPYASLLANEDADEWNAAHPDEPLKTGRDIEYEEIEETFRSSFPKEKKILFSRDKIASELKNGAPDYYVFDIGGLDGFTMVGGRCKRFADELVAQIAEHPSTLFVPWSSFTQSYIEGALCDLLGEECWVDKTIPPNVIVLDEKERRSNVEAIVLDKLKAAYQKRRRKKK